MRSEEGGMGNEEREGNKEGGARGLFLRAIMNMSRGLRIKDDAGREKEVKMCVFIFWSVPARRRFFGACGLVCPPAGTTRRAFRKRRHVAAPQIKKGR
jgi:hypothetical protein